MPRRTSNPRYEAPYTLDRILEIYGPDVYDRLRNDPVHEWRAESGIELIHKEPTYGEFRRVWRNWNLMDDSMKAESDRKSLELFGMDNAEHYLVLKSRYFVDKVLSTAKKMGLNVFVVSDGASGIHNNGNPAVENARKAQIAWEKDNGFDPDADWGMDIHEN